MYRAAKQVLEDNESIVTDLIPLILDYLVDIPFPSFCGFCKQWGCPTCRKGTMMKRIHYKVYDINWWDIQSRNWMSYYNARHELILDIIFLCRRAVNDQLSPSVARFLSINHYLCKGQSIYVKEQQEQITHIQQLNQVLPFLQHEHNVNSHYFEPLRGVSVQFTMEDGNVCTFPLAPAKIFNGILDQWENDAGEFVSNPTPCHIIPQMKYRHPIDSLFDEQNSSSSEEDTSEEEETDS